ncbi:MAG: dTDP-4-dehydrorhamnose 3,5-epimerase [bacterium]
MKDKIKIGGVEVTRLKVLPTEGGCVMHGLKKGDKDFAGFGETYFSSIEAGHIRGWKRHREMTLNLVVVAGEVRFVLIEEKDQIHSREFDEVILSPKHNYARLCVPPGIWVAFQGVANPISILANIANIEHDPSEADQVSIDHFDFDW